MKSRGWFGPKPFGWGVSPRSWQGWLITAAYVVALICIASLPLITKPDKLMYIGAATVILIAVAIMTYRKDETRDGS